MTPESSPPALPAPSTTNGPLPFVEHALNPAGSHVHNHLASGAASLCQGKGPVALDQLQSEADPHLIPEQLADVQPPLDYAPKTSPDEKGMLNEEFGLDRQPTQVVEEEPRAS